MAEKKKTYTGAMSSAVLQGLSTAVWVTAGGLPPGRRRAVRAGVVAVGVAVAAVQYRREQQREPRLLDRPVLVKDVLAGEVTPAEQAGPGLPPRATLVALAVSTGVALGGRQVEKRWLARLIRDGHPRPHRSLGIRMGMLMTATALVSEVVAVVDDRRGERVRAEPAD